MIVFNACLVLVGCVLAVQAASWRGCGCGHPCGLDSGESMCGCKFGPSNWRSSGFIGTAEECKDRCEPIVGRPQEVPKPVLSVSTSLTPLPGLCACKKAIVKPAILPKPVCKATAGYGGSAIVGVNTASYNQNVNGQSTSTLYGIGGAPLMLDGAVSLAAGNPAVLTPADAVSIAIAQKNAQQQCILDEDRLAFGFRKIPVEIPVQKIIRQNNIPEEKIFSLNGQIVELKPVKVCCGTKTLDEEAAEDLLALQEEETAGVGEECQSAIKRISLGELGYGPAKISEKTFVDVPGSAVEAAASAVGSAVGGVVDSFMEGASGFQAGNVVYKTIPNPVPVVIPAVADTADCESNEAGEEQSVIYEEDSHGSCGAPVYGYGAPTVCQSSSYSSSASSKTKKASVIIQKLCTRD